MNAFRDLIVLALVNYSWKFCVFEDIDMYCNGFVVVVYVWEHFVGQLCMNNCWIKLLCDCDMDETGHVVAWETTTCMCLQQQHACVCMRELVLACVCTLHERKWMLPKWALNRGKFAMYCYCSQKILPTK
jgi:hypothetical protein